MWVPEYAPQQRHFQLLKTFRSTGEQHLTTPRVNKNISTEETWSWIPDFKKEKILHPKKEKLQFCSYLSCMSKHLGTWKKRNLIVQIITDPTEKPTLSSSGRNVTISLFGLNLCSFILCNKIRRLFILTVKKNRRQGQCAFGHLVQLYI